MSQIHSTTSEIGTRDHQPIQARLQIAATRSGRDANRVHTLHGFAWRAHTSSDMRKIFVNVCSSGILGVSTEAQIVSFGTIFPNPGSR